MRLRTQTTACWRTIAQTDRVLRGGGGGAQSVRRINVLKRVLNLCQAVTNTSKRTVSKRTMNIASAFALLQVSGRRSKHGSQNAYFARRAAWESPLPGTGLAPTNTHDEAARLLVQCRSEERTNVREDRVAALVLLCARKRQAHSTRAE